MKSIDKIGQLSSIIYDNILPLINNDYVLYGLPYYTNIGDTLIWEGELHLLKKVKHRCLGTCAWNEYPKRKVNKNVVVLITGGGYFGDTWRDGWNHVMSGIEGLEDNRIIILPNSIYYNDVAVRDKDSKYLSNFKDLIICARDKISYDYAKRYFRNRVLLVPDMAFCIPPNNIHKRVTRADKTLYLKRIDKELSAQLPDEMIGGNVETHDWPTFNEPGVPQRLFYKIYSKLWTLNNRKLLSDRHFLLLKKLLFNNIHRPLMTYTGISFLSKYKTIYTTRLHAMILGMMMDRTVFFLDNSYGKLSNYYETWLIDCDNVREYDDK